MGEERSKEDMQKSLLPDIDKLKKDAETWVPTELPEFDKDPLYLTPEEELEIVEEIRRRRNAQRK